MRVAVTSGLRKIFLIFLKFPSFEGNEIINEKPGFPAFPGEVKFPSILPVPQRLLDAQRT